METILPLVNFTEPTVVVVAEVGMVQQPTILTLEEEVALLVAEVLKTLQLLVHTAEPQLAAKVTMAVKADNTISMAAAVEVVLVVLELKAVQLQHLVPVESEVQVL
jgi:hypothetical protein